MSSEPPTIADPAKDPPTVTREGRRLASSIDGVELRPATVQVDDRGEVTEIFSPAWGVCPDPLVYVYQSIIRPHKAKGWVVHHEQHDRLFVSLGFLKIVLYDARPESTSHGLVQELHVSERNRALLVIPPGVFHAILNVGDVDAVFVNMPTRPYRHDNPDKYRLPLDTDQIPYDFVERLGG
jgi:dTDP-4-dehydrorhamnose 3,5-epimerase